MMDNEITIIDGQEYSEGQEAIVSKRIKVNDQKLSAIASHKRIVEEKEEPVKVIESVEEKQEIKEEPVVEEEPYFVKNNEKQSKQIKRIHKSMPAVGYNMPPLGCGGHQRVQLGRDTKRERQNL